MCCSMMNHRFHTYLFLVLSLGTKPEFINRQIWMKRLSPNSAQRYFFSCLLSTATVFISTHWHPFPSSSTIQASLKKFLDYIQTGAIEKMAKVLDKGLDPNFHDPDSGGEFATTLCVLSLWKLKRYTDSFFAFKWMILQAILVMNMKYFKCI